MQKPLVVGNWKMNGSSSQMLSLIEALLDHFKSEGQIEVDVGVCPPEIYLYPARQLLKGSSVFLGAQNVSEEKQGAFTGDVSAEMLADVGCHFVIVGHSERRIRYLETNQQIAKKLNISIDVGLTPILCVGETLDDRESGKTLQVIEDQLQVLSGLNASGKVEIAYEPIWAIGTGRTARTEQIQEVHAYIRNFLGSAGNTTRLLYGGSVNASNAAELFVLDDVDGALVGGASLNANEFFRICQAANLN